MVLKQEYDYLTSTSASTGNLRKHPISFAVGFMIVRYCGNHRDSRSSAGELYPSTCSFKCALFCEQNLFERVAFRYDVARLFVRKRACFVRKQVRDRAVCLARVDRLAGRPRAQTSRRRHERCSPSMRNLRYGVARNAEWYVTEVRTFERAVAKLSVRRASPANADVPP